MLTAAQLTTLKAHIAANTATVIWLGSPTAINTLPNNSDANDAIAKWYSGAASPAYWIWRTDVPTPEIHDKITWQNYTPAEPITALNASEWTARSMSCQGKQFNIQIMLQTFSGVVNASRTNIRGGLNDATTNLPSGLLFATITGGWVNILPILRRTALNIEKLFSEAATGAGNNGANPRGDTTNPDAPTFEGPINYQDVENARNS